MDTLKKQVEGILKQYPDARDSDVYLTILIWIKHFSRFLFKRISPDDNKEVWCMELRNLFKLPSQDNIKRWRAKFQNEEGMYLPTKWEIARKRNIKEEDWRKALGYNPEMRTPGIGSY